MRMKKCMAALLAVILVFSIAGCNSDPAQSSDPTQGQSGDKATYTVSVKTAGGMPMEGLDIYIYADETLEDLEQFGKTDANGNAEISLAQKDGYVAVISGAPKGYAVEKCYKLTGAYTPISLTSSLITDGNVQDGQLGLGDVMYDFSVTDAQGNKITLSEMLKEKDMVLLNFWYTTCTWCLEEFPDMEAVYRRYEDQVGIVALNPYEGNDVIKPFQDSNGLSFNMVECPMSWANAFGVTGYPTSIVVDRYGVICLVVTGGLTSETYFVNIFEHFTGENYVQKLCTNGMADITVQVKPTYEMPSNEELSAALNKGEINVTYTGAGGDDDEYNWPFILTEKNGETVACASNVGIDSSYSILTVQAELKTGQALCFEYLSSCESGSDIFYVIVDGEDIYQISGWNEEEKWEKCCPWVADRDDTYEIALCYLKDDGDAAGDDTVYIRNMHVVNADDIDTPTYIPRQAAVETEDGYTYVNVVYNAKDGYYHVGSENGPLLMATLNTTCQFNEDKSVLQMITDGDITVNGKNYYEDILPFCSYASNSSLYGLCTVNKELAEYLKIVTDVAGFEDDGSVDDENEWLKICSYYATYGTNGLQLTDPIAGLATFSALDATLGKNVESNFYYYDRVIMPRGLFAKFVPTKSGVYRITSRTDTDSDVEGWIFDKDMKELTVYEMDERLNTDDHNVSIVYYMEAGVEYYIDICFWDLYETGYIYYDIEYIAATYDHFRLASPGYFTYDADATGETMYYTIAGGVKPVLKNGKYYVDLGNGKTGSLLYADFSGITPIFNMPLQQIIEKGGFDFTKTESDETVLEYMAKNDNDPEKTKAYLKELWGDSYAANAENYKLEDVLNGRFHGTGEDLTEQARAYISKMATGPIERIGCVEVDEALAQLLQKLMDKYTFAGVDHSWTKVCYYYDHLGPQN